MPIIRIAGKPREKGCTDMKFAGSEFEPNKSPLLPLRGWDFNSATLHSSPKHIS
jgi:hypothetical protein